MNHLSLFSGIGGLDLAAEWAGFRTVGFVERDPYCQRVLAKHWPGVPIWSDVAEVTADSIRERSAVGTPDEARGALHDGQRHDAQQERERVAGKRKASADERDLWGEFRRIVCEVRPRWVVAENVPGLLSSESGRFFGNVVGDLAAMGYGVAWFVYGACDVGAPHRRDRVFIVAHAGHARGRPDAAQRGVPRELGVCAERSQADGIAGTAGEAMAHADEQGSQGWISEVLRERSGERVVGAGGAWRAGPDGECWRVEPAVGRVASRIPRRVDRLRALGNAVVPAQAFPIFKAIADIERLTTVSDSHL